MKLRNSILLMITASMILAFSCACGNESGNSGKGSFSVESAFIQESGNHLMINAEYPVVKGVAGVEDLNTEIKESVENAAEEVRSAALELEGREGFTASLNSDYQYFNNKNIASIWINFDNYTGGAHGLYWIDSYTLNTDTGQIYTFPMLFIEDKGGV
ncbi:MAG TPA: DUF4163 domain-containing protein, partial [Anaerovoracaceae bacterium]|nr:DUF4163 domain-containing protein [Anaerovoracaceae bacterium]